MNLWRRIARLANQSRIRLPAQPIRASELRPGDWVQVGSERFRVMARRFEADHVMFRLRPLHGSVGGLLVGPRESPGNWIFDRGGSEISIPPELLVVFPVV